MATFFFFKKWLNDVIDLQLHDRRSTAHLILPAENRREIVARGTARSYKILTSANSKLRQYSYARKYLLRRVKNNSSTKSTGYVQVYVNKTRPLFFIILSAETRVDCLFSSETVIF